MLKEDLINLIKQDRPEIKDISVEAHANRVLYLFSISKSKDSVKQLFVDYKKVVNLLEKIYKNLETKKNTIVSIIVVLKALKSSQSTIKKYTALLEVLKKSITDIKETNEKTKKDEENWISLKEIKELKEKILTETKSLSGKELVNRCQDFVLLSIYTLIPPIRSDYIKTLVYNEIIPELNSDFNYIFLTDKKLILNSYKTSKNYGSIKIDLSQEYVDIVSDFMRLRNNIFPSLKDCKYLLLNNKNKPLSNVVLAQHLNRIFNYKKISTTMLRKIFISEKYLCNFSYKEMKNDAKAMCHSVAIQQCIYRKK